MNLRSAPPNWHFVVNFPVGLVWMIGIPFVSCWLLSIPLWWAIVIAPIWSLLTGRIPDRWLPEITGPVIDRAFLTFVGKQRVSSPLKPESDFIVETTDAYVRSTRPDGTIEEVLWDELSGVDIETNSLGPLAPDVFWILHGYHGGCIIPQGATGDRELLERLQQLPGLDNRRFIDAMSSTSEATFEVWRRIKDTEQAAT